MLERHPLGALQTSFKGSKLHQLQLQTKKTKVKGPRLRSHAPTFLVLPVRRLRRRQKVRRPLHGAHQRVRRSVQVLRPLHIPVRRSLLFAHVQHFVPQARSRVPAQQLRNAVLFHPGRPSALIQQDQPAVIFQQVRRLQRVRLSVLIQQVRDIQHVRQAIVFQPVRRSVLFQPVRRSVLFQHVRRPVLFQQQEGRRGLVQQVPRQVLVEQVLRSAQQQQQQVRVQPLLLLPERLDSRLQLRPPINVHPKRPRPRRASHSSPLISSLLQPRQPRPVPVHTRQVLVRPNVRSVLQRQVRIVQRVQAPASLKPL